MTPAPTSVKQDLDGQAVPATAAPVAAFEIVDREQPGAYGFSVRVAATGRRYRITPARDPHEPRFWCVVVYRCTPGGLPDAGERPWLGRAGMRRDELGAALTAIRDDVEGWLAAMPSPALAQWFLAPPDHSAPMDRAGGLASRRSRQEATERRTGAR